MKQVGYYLDEAVDAEIAEATAKMKRTGVPRMGKGLLVTKAWEAFKRTPEYRQLMKGA